VIRCADYVLDIGPGAGESGGRVVAAAARWPVRTLLLYAGDDRLVAPRGSDAFAAAAAGGSAGSSASHAAVTAQRFAALYHEIFNEPDSAPVLKALAAWLDARG
jgi:alpha-beta hydrolase superfamily lysophospholipase